jgi:hypothetical protein
MKQLQIFGSKTNEMGIQTDDGSLDRKKPNNLDLMQPVLQQQKKQRL